LTVGLEIIRSDTWPSRNFKSQKVSGSDETGIGSNVGIIFRG
jgi:hypothetical protein